MWKTQEWGCDNCHDKFTGKRNTNSVNKFCTSGCAIEFRSKNAKLNFKIIDNIVEIYIKDFTSYIDIDNIDLIQNRVWNINKSGYLFGWNYNRTKLEYLHRVILDCDPNKDVDHINGNTLDNRKENLRVCETHQNMSNSKLYSNNTSGIKGVGYNKKSGKWEARIGFKGTSIFLGYFNLLSDAQLARTNAEEEYHGEYKSKR